MKKYTFDFTLSFANERYGKREEKIAASVPGAVQLDYAKAKNYPPYTWGCNYKMYDWMEDKYFFYETDLAFDVKVGESARLTFEGIDYGYEILIDGETVKKGEGAFTPIHLDVTPWSGKKHTLTVVVAPIPTRGIEKRDRVQASACCKPPSSYEWDWHPRLVPSGIYKDAYLEILPEGAVRDLELSYRLSDALDIVTVSACVKVFGAYTGDVVFDLIDQSGEVVASEKAKAENGISSASLTLKNPLLWYPRGYGEHPRYTVRASGNGEVSRKIGFRRSRLILNHNAKEIQGGKFPTGPMPSPMQLEINGEKVFVKGSNFVNTEIFPSLVTKERYKELIDLAVSANMNTFRMWGGQYIKLDCFYDYCDEVGMLVWQEFMLSCNQYPDTDEYLDVLKQEATSIIKSIRSHPCLAFWCGGNELFCDWSNNTDQTHALRLLDSLCYEYDRFTPFHMTSPMHGVGHGTYTKVTIPDSNTADPKYDQGEEFYTIVRNNDKTAYTEFGSCGAATKEYITKYIMSEKDYLDCNPENENWVAHHAFGAWENANWLAIPDVKYFFGSYKDVDDLMEKSLFLQDISYQTLFEEMRRQAPNCSMAINWDFNEPWPCAAGNSLVNWPAEPKSCLKRVGAALRDRILSIRTERNRFLTGQTFTASVWVLNDCPSVCEALTAKVYLVCGEEKKLLSTVTTSPVGARENGEFGTFSFEVDKSIPERFKIEIVCEENDAYSSTYDFVHLSK